MECDVDSGLWSAISAEIACGPRPVGSIAGFSANSSASKVWNVNFGSEITTTDNFTGAAAENTANSFWNSVPVQSITTSYLLTLKDSTNASGTVTMTLTAASTTKAIAVSRSDITGPEIFDTWAKAQGNDTPFAMTIAGLEPGRTYDLVIYSDWFWKGNEWLPVNQTTGSGLTGTAHLDQISTGANGVVPGLVEDTSLAQNGSIEGNWIRIAGLTPNQSGILGFSIGGRNSALSGFQLIQMGTGTPDETPPSPSPMTWATAPADGGSDSITMTATTATDAGGVEYYFDETSGNPGGTDSGWQASPTYTDTGLNPSTTYTYTVTARDRSAALNTTSASIPASATTSAPRTLTVWNVQFASQAGNQITTSDNFTGAAVENTANSTWNRVASIPQSGMVLKKSTGEDTGVTLDFTGGSIGTLNVTSGDKLFNSRVGGGSTSTLTLKGLSMTNSYDIVFYSDWWWRNGDALPITQTVGSGLAGTFFLNRILTGTNGVLPALTRDSNPENVISGPGNTGNWMRVDGLVPTINGEIAFRITDGNNTPFNGFQLIATRIPPKAEMLTMSLASNPPSIRNAVISGTNVTLTVPFGTDPANLAPTYVLWPGATCATPSGSARNFTTPQTYTVTSSDSLETNNYIVAVTTAPPLPEFTLSAPGNWDGRSAITVQPVITNLAELQASNGTNFTYDWGTSGLAVTATATGGVMTLSRSQGTGAMLVTLTMTNGTEPVTRTISIDVQEPATDAWLERAPLPNEKPVDGQFFARNPSTNQGTLYYRGTQSGTPDDVFLKIYRTPAGGSEVLHATHRQPLNGGAYDFTSLLDAGLFTYRVVYGTRTAGIDTDVATVGNLLCGDAFIISGQSNAQATNNGAPQADTSDPWVMTYDAELGWRPAYAKPTSPNWGSKVGFWGMKLAQELVSRHSIPICIINGAVGGTRIDQHQPNPDNRTVGAGTYDLYANLLNRVTAARLTHGIRAVFWHQGENDVSASGPPLEGDYLFYERNFLNMSSAWKQDYPNFLHYFIYQIEPNPCGMGPFASQLREVQRNLPRLFSNMSIIHNLGLPGYDGCHYTMAGYESMAARLLPVVERDLYGIDSGSHATPPNLVKASFTSSARTAILLQFDQPMVWNQLSTPNYHLNGMGNQVVSGSANGNTVTLQLSVPAGGNTSLQYLRDDWNRDPSTLLYGLNGIPAFTFTDVGVREPVAYEVWTNDRGLAGPNAGSYADPDGDGVENILEFVLGGQPNPAAPDSNSRSLLPVSRVNNSGDMVFSFRRRLDSVGQVVLSFQWSSSLIFSPSDTISIGAGGGSSDGLTVAMAPYDATHETVTITVPSSKAVGGKIFARLVALAP